MNAHQRGLSDLNRISEIKDHLFLSGIAVIRADAVRRLGVTVIVNATTEESTPHVAGVEVLRIRVDDHPSANLFVHFNSIADKIKSVKESGGRVLVHCMAGVSRSASLVLAYLIKYERLTLRQAYFYVKSVRSIIRPNLGFWKQLVDFERKTRGYPSVTLVQTRLHELPLPDVYADELRDASNAAERDAARHRSQSQSSSASSAASKLAPSSSSATPSSLSKYSSTPLGSRLSAALASAASSGGSLTAPSKHAAYRPFRSLISSHTVPSRLSAFRSTGPSSSSLSTTSRLFSPNSASFAHTFSMH